MSALAPEEFQYELMLRDDGSVILTLGGEVMWTSDGDDEFVEEFGVETVDSEDIPDVIAWLTDNDYIPPGIEPSIVDESEDGDAWDDEDDWDDEHDEDDWDEDDEDQEES